MGAALTTMAVVSAVSMSSSASAATNPYTAAGVCGSGYSTIETKSSTYATVYLMWNGSNGHNCVVTLKSGAAAGSSTRTAVWLEARGGAFQKDDANYTWYAGPVRFYAAGTCVMFGGYTKYGSGVYGGEDLSWDHCGG
ncbi:hypothetical protein [Micromonospora deserti]|uniref:hypothetical protein n=1 Tax=Micromonospora deserti TaxID=2070366 RepID=UPI0018F522AC|nr:hypothetical protein [Micromonospora deserti]